MMGGDAADGDNESGIPRLGGRLDALSALVTAAAEAAGKAKHVYVLKFFGDVTASQVAQLRQEVTAVLRSADAEGRGDEVVLVLNTGGGTVTGYGLAAAQLQRLKGAGLHLTVCVEQVAASGGYMMACTADKIVASPFAVVGSIGVITEQPNVFERLEKEGVKFSTVTAGKYKRTLTPTKKIDPKDLAKLEDDIAQILKLFKGFVAENRPQLDIEKVATGETWFGPDALERKLVDHLATVDDVLLEHVDAGSQVYGVTYTEKPKSPLAALGLPGGAAAAPLQALALDALTRAAGAGGAAFGAPSPRRRRCSGAAAAPPRCCGGRTSRSRWPRARPTRRSRWRGGRATTRPTRGTCDERVESSGAVVINCGDEASHPGTRASKSVQLLLPVHRLFSSSVLTACGRRCRHAPRLAWAPRVAPHRAPPKLRRSTTTRRADG